MREIKFRAKSGTQWRYGDLYHNERGELMIYEPKTSGQTLDGKAVDGWRIKVDPETIGQFTGLYDADGREIYEGDVLEFAVFDYQGLDVEYRGVVEWCGSRFIVSVCLVLAPKTWRKKRDYEESYYDLDWLLDQDDEVKIIGNVHDNSDLLECKP